MKRLSPEIKNLLSLYKARRNEIKQRLAEFKKKSEAGKEELFAELCFCLCTPQSKALNCDKAVRRLKSAGNLSNGSAEEVAACLKGLVRFHNNKAKYIIEARKKFRDVVKTREWLVKNIKGLGLKEASHFLRNIGLGDNLAIIDRHILTNLKKYGAIKNIPKSISKNEYLTLEKKLLQFSKKIGISAAELDLLFWSNQTGHIFK